MRHLNVIKNSLTLIFEEEGGSNEIGKVHHFLHVRKKKLSLNKSTNIIVAKNLKQSVSARKKYSEAPQPVSLLS